MATPRILTDPIRGGPASLRVLHGAGPTLQGVVEKEGRMLDLLMVVLTLVSFVVFVAMVAWLERV